MIDDINEEAEEEAVEAVEAVEATGAEESTATTPGLGINDLRIFKQIIDICTTRGAFKAEEFTSIGESYDKLASFLAMVDAKAAEASEEGAEDTTETNADETAEDTTEETEA
jgi:hypothetical protein